MTYTKTVKTPPVAKSFGSSTFGSGSSIFGDLFYPTKYWLLRIAIRIADGGSVYYRQDNAIQHRFGRLNARIQSVG